MNKERASPEGPPPKGSEWQAGNFRGQQISLATLTTHRAFSEHRMGPSRHLPVTGSAARDQPDTPTGGFGELLGCHSFPLTDQGTVGGGGLGAHCTGKSSSYAALSLPPALPLRLREPLLVLGHSCASARPPFPKNGPAAEKAAQGAQSTGGQGSTTKSRASPFLPAAAE